MNFDPEIHALSQAVKTGQKTHLILDLDRTLAHMLIDWREWHEPSGIISCVLQFDPDYPQTRLGHKGINDATRRFGPRLEQKFIEFETNYELAHFRGYRLNEPLYHYIKQNPDQLQFSLYTSNVKAVVYPLLVELGLEQTFAHVVTMDKVTYIKPDPEGFRYILDPHIPKSRYLMVGDSASDQGAAAEAGIDYFQVHYFGAKLDET